MAAYQTLTELGYHVLQPIFELFREPGVPIVLTVGFLVVLILASALFVLQTQRPLRQIREVTQPLVNLEGHGQLTAALHDVAESMRQQDTLRHAWQEFEETLITPEPDQAQLVRNTARPSEYFNREGLDSKLSIYHALPNYFIGFGLLFTFLGIVAALHFASEGVTGSIEEAQMALGGLLGAATFKFITSIAGLACSIVFSLLYRWRIRAIDRAFAVLCDQLERLMSFAAPEQLAALQLRQLEHQTSEIRRFNTNIAMEIADAMASRLDASIADGLRRAIDPLTQAVERLSAGMSEDNRGAVREMVELFQQQLKQGAGRELAALGEALGRMQGVLASATESFGRQSEAFGGRIAEAAARLDQAVESAAAGLGRGAEDAGRRLDDHVTASMETLGGALGRAGDGFAARLDGIVMGIGRTLVPLGERLAGFQSTLVGLDERLEAHAAAFAEVASQTRASAEAMGSVSARMREAGEPLAAGLHALREAGREAARAIEAVRAVQDQVGEVAKQIAATSQTLERSWSAYERRFDQVDGSLERVFSKFAEGTQGQFELVKAFTKDLDAALESAVVTLTQNVDQLRETLDDSVDELRKALPRVPVRT